MKLSTILIFALIILSQILPAQEITFPHPLPAGSQFTAPSSADTLFWILRSSQYQTAVRKAEELQLADSTISLLKIKNSKLEEIISKKDSSFTELEQGYERYKNMWTECDLNLEEVEIELVRTRKKIFIFSLVGIIAGGTAGALLF